MERTDSIGSSFGGSNVVLQSGRDTTIQGSAVNADRALIIDAKRDLAITAAQDTYSESHFSQTTKEATGLAKGIATVIAVTNPLAALTPNSVEQVAIAALLTKKSQSGTQTSTSTTSVGSQLTGGTVLTRSGRDTLVEGSAIVADGDIAMSAGRDLTITTAQNTQTSDTASQSTTRGLLRFEATGNSIGKREQTQSSQGTAVSNTSSQIVSLGKGGADGKSGSIDLSAIGNTTITGSSVIAPGGDIAISGGNVLINEVHNTTTQAEQSRFKETSASVQIKSGYVEAVKGAAANIETARTAKEDTGSSRMAGLATLNAAMSVYSAASGIAGSANASSASAAPISAISISGSIGQSKSEGNSTANSSTAQGGTLAAGGTLSISANGDNSTGNGKLTMIGTQASAGKEANLSATGEMNLLAAANTSDMRSTNSGSNASMGATFALGGQQNGLSFQAGAQGSSGKANGDETSYSNTTIQVGSAAQPGTLNISSGGNTTLRGATASANTVNADIKGNLTIESLQDTSSYDSKQTSVGAGVSVCVPPLCYGTMVVVNVNAAQSKIDGDYASVGEQSALRAGDGGFNVKVGGDTTLKGGAITSTQKAIDDNKNSFATGGKLITSDLLNTSELDAKSISASLSTGTGSTSGSMGYGSVQDSRSSTTTAAISGIAGNTDARTGDKETGIKPVFTAADAAKIDKSLNVQTEITQATVNQAVKFTNEAYRKIFVDAHPMYKIVKDENGQTVMDPATNKPKLELLTPEERAGLKPGPDGKINIATNGIFNSNAEAGAYANQHSTTTGTQYVIYFPEANNAISELLVAGYQKFLESPTLGLSNSTVQVIDAMNQYGTTGLQLDGHSRGALTIGSALEAQNTLPNSQGSLSNTNINFYGPAYNAQQADNLLAPLQDRANMPAAQQPGAVLQMQNHFADPVGGLIGGNPGTGGTIPEGSSAAGQAIRAVTLQPNTVHNCYGKSANDGCANLWRDTGNFPQLTPAITPLGIKK